MSHACPSQLPQNQSFTSATTANGQGELTELAKVFLEKRGLTLAIASQMGLYSKPRGDGGEWLAIPYRRDGDVVNTKFRRLDEKEFQQTQGGEQCLYNQDGIDENKPLLIVEGEFDCLAAIQCGFNAVSVPGGATANYEWIEIPKAVKEVIICADNDGAGKKLLESLLDRIGRPRCKVIRYPKGCKDLNEVLIAYGQNGVEQSVAKATWVNAGGLWSFSDLPDLPTPKKYSLKLPLLECYIREGEFSVVTGYPGVGKSTILNIVARDVVEQGCKVCFASFEQPPAIQKPRLVQAFNRGDKSLSSKSLESINDSIKIITPPELAGKQSDGEPTDVGWLLTQMAAASIRFGVKWFIVDPWNEMEHNYPKGMTLTQYVGKAIMEIKRFAKEYAVHVTIVAHPSKPPHELAGNKPSLHSISDSQHWYNKADLGIVFARHKVGEEKYINEIEVAKSRYEDEIGKLGRQFYEISFASQSLIPASDELVQEVLPKKKRIGV